MLHSRVFSLQAWTFSVALFISAALLFSIQPIVSKMLLPILGGSPAVWNTTVVFFQTVLVAGYLYAYVVARFLSLRAQMIVHIVVLAAAGLRPRSWPRYQVVNGVRHQSSDALCGLV